MMSRVVIAMDLYRRSTVRTVSISTLRLFSAEKIWDGHDETRRWRGQELSGRTRRAYHSGASTRVMQTRRKSGSIIERSRA